MDINPIANRTVLNSRKVIFCLYWELGPSDQNVRCCTCGNSIRIYLRTGFRCAQIPTGPCSRFDDIVQRHTGCCDLLYRITVWRLAWAWLVPKWTDCILLWYLQLKFSEKSTCTMPSSSLILFLFSLKAANCLCIVNQCLLKAFTAEKKHCYCFSVCYLFHYFSSDFNFFFLTILRVSFLSSLLFLIACVMFWKFSCM